MRTTEREAFSLTDKVKPAGWDVLKLLGSTRSRLGLPEEVACDRPYADVEDRVGSYGLAEYLGGAPEAWDRFSRAETTHPLAWASTRAAVDWYRLTTRPLPERLLLNVSLDYLPIGRRYDDFDRKAELAWATERVNETVRLLLPAGPDSWRPFDYIVDRVSQDHPEMPETTWAAIEGEDFDPMALARVGLVAYEAAKAALAERLWRQVVIEVVGDHADRSASARSACAST